MSNHPIIKALQDDLSKEISKLADESFAKEYAKWTKEEKRPFHYVESFKHGHEAATARLLSLLEKAVETITTLGERHPDCFCMDREGIAREFLTTLAEASGDK